MPAPTFSLPVPTAGQTTKQLLDTELNRVLVQLWAAILEGGDEAAIDALVDQIEVIRGQAQAAETGAVTARGLAEDARDLAEIYAGIVSRASLVAGLTDPDTLAVGDGGYVSGSGDPAVDGVYEVQAGTPQTWLRVGDTGLAGKASKSDVQELRRSAVVTARRETAAASRANLKRGRIYATVGQSLSVRRNYTSGQPKVDWTSPHAYMIAGGADRNADPDVSPNVAAFNVDGLKYESLVQFVPGTTQGGKIDGFAMMADHPAVCGIYAIGARDYTELRKGGAAGALFVDFSMFLSQAVHLLRTEYECGPIDIILSFAHGEADADTFFPGNTPGNTPTTYAAYKLFMAEWFYDLTMTARLALDDPEYQPTFLLHQMGGVFNDAWRAIMEAQVDFSREYPNTHLAGPTAPYGFETDRIHPPGEAQALMGEYNWHLANRALAGLPTCLQAHEFRRSGATITVPHNYVEAAVEVGINAGNMTDASGFQGAGAACILGVEVFVDGARVDLDSVTPGGLATVIVLAADPGSPTEVVVRFGLMTAPGGNGGVPATTSRCNIRSSWPGIPSRYITSFTHQAWLIHEEVEEAL